MASGLRLDETVDTPEKPTLLSRIYAQSGPNRVLALCLLVVTCVQIVVCFGTIDYYAENALFELSQDVFLFTGAALFFASAVRATNRVSRLALLGLTLFCLSILFRELDVRGTFAEPYLGAALQNRFHYVFLGILWLSLLLLSLRHFRLSVVIVLRWLLTFSGALMISGILFYVLGDVAEKRFFTGNPAWSEMLEESIEQLGTLFILLSAWVALRRPLYARTSPPCSAKAEILSVQGVS